MKILPFTAFLPFAGIASAQSILPDETTQLAILVGVVLAILIFLALYLQKERSEETVRVPAVAKKMSPRRESIAKRLRQLWNNQKKSRSQP